MGSLCSSYSPWGSCLREACGCVEEHQIIPSAGRDDTRPVVILALQLGHMEAAGTSIPEQWLRVGLPDDPK